MASSNYYGQFNNEEIALYKEQYGKIIVDSAQAFYQPRVQGIDTIYTCRKFFDPPCPNQINKCISPTI